MLSGMMPTSPRAQSTALGINPSKLVVTGIVDSGKSMNTK